jgi:alkanesulfonate monooxygenase SsuD/methylene tetrahydromethanopterin reductase-like flavin-dependent oxidoreductase (luciferase family)
MDGATRTEQLREASNPLFNDRKLKLGTFCTNLSGGCTMSTIEGVLRPDWPSSLELARMGDEMEFEALVPVARWKGFDGITDFNASGFESFTWAAAVSALTKTSGVFSTTHVPTMHPIMAAKQAMTVDHVSNGRFALNIVTGWHQPEIEMFGAPLLEHDRRYAMAIEWLQIIKRLWTEEEAFDFDGEFYKLKAACAHPKPIQKPYPVVMCAGVSPKGREFAAKYCDVSFVSLDSHELADMRARVESVRSLARREFGREIQVWGNAYIFQGDTERDAQAYYRHAIIDNGDWPGVENMLRIMGINSQSIPPEKLPLLKEHFIAGWGGYGIVGAREQVVEGLERLAQAGFDGILLSWPRFLDDMRRFQAEIYPLVRQTGLR